jgi:hypothetical protein
MLTTILIVILILILLGGLGGPYVNPNWQHGYGAGWYGTGLIGLLLIIVLVLLIVGVLPPLRAY